MTVNPLDFPGQLFELELFNPNPSSSKTKEGPKYRISFEVEREIWDLFMASKTEGMIIVAQATVYAEEQAPAAVSQPTEIRWGEEAKILRQSGFFRAPDVWKAIGTDKQYLAWLKTQPCAYGDADMKHHAHECTGQVVPAHVRRVANGAGTGIKPEYSAISLCHHHHTKQHNDGESAMGGKEWFDKKRIQHVERWAWETLKASLGFESWTQVAPLTLYNWAVEKGVNKYLPDIYKP